MARMRTVRIRPARSGWDAGSALDDRICFALYAASRAVTGVYRPLLDGLGITYPQYLVMLVLWNAGGEGVTVKEMGRALHLDYGTVTPLLKRLEAAGLVRRARRQDDERAVQVTVTECGAALRDRTHGIAGAVGEAMGLAAEESDRIRDVLRRLTDNAARYANRPLTAE
ncbi:DNA-binding transcriptional regulator, MarR family [Actinacidiphila alni]|uniref:DNA-binding transcriptional regulator, MarR family n=1 Tax=Actinacidiphila alni TaxID=380248 RepID=A0A1I2J2Z1_9ACTN|nr:MarR family transcriptional regulator [Actinacidiphila alni]SFF47637.1 DNA-binding transcriptional regulator, MarR family [Actinacidiphila alni]